MTATWPECHVSHICRIKVIRKKWRSCIDLACTVWLRKIQENLRNSLKAAKTSHPLKIRLLTSKEVGRIAQIVMEEDVKKEWMN